MATLSTKDAGNLVLEYKDRFEKILPAHMNIEKFLSLIGTTLRENPKWEKIDSLSLIGSLLHCAYLGLEPGSHRQQIYLIGYAERDKNRAVVKTVIKPMLGYQGMIELLGRSGMEKIFAEVVYSHDTFRLWNDLEGTCQHMRHDIDIDAVRSGKPNDIRGAYAVVLNDNKVPTFAWLSREEIKRDHIKENNPVWSTNYSEMCKKTAIRRIYKTQAKDPLISTAIAREENESFDFGSLAKEVIGETKPSKATILDQLIGEGIES